jgi:hypothetical protein
MKFLSLVGVSLSLALATTTYGQNTKPSKPLKYPRKSIGSLNGNRTPDNKTIQKEAPKTPPKIWGLLTKNQSDKVTVKLKAFGERVNKQIPAKLTLYETDNFLFYSDLDKKEAMRWQHQINKMYTRVLKMFKIPTKTNVWHGKAMIFVFKNKKDFVQYEREVEENPSNMANAAGFCHTMGPLVRIAFYRQPVDSTFASILVHETCHGIIHRYRSPNRIPTWVNEGLSEWIAYHDGVVNNASRSEMKRARDYTAINTLAKTGSLGGMFDKWNGGSHYGIAYKYTGFLIKYKSKQWVKFLNALKDDTSQEEAFEASFGMSQEKMTRAFGRWMRLNRPLTP